MPYKIDIYDRTNSTKTDQLQSATGITFTRDIRGTREIRFRIARDDDQLSVCALGTVVRVYESETSTDLAVGEIAGTVSLGSRPEVTFTAEGLWRRLASVVFPADYVLVGDISSAENKLRLTQSYDFRRITAVDPASHDGDEIVSWDGLAAGTTQEKAAKTNTITWDIVKEGSTEDATGSLTLDGTSDNDGDGINEIPPFSASGTYESPFYDFVTAPDDVDRLRFDGSYDEGTVQWAVNTFPTLVTARTFGAPAAPTFPGGEGEDITALTAQRFMAVEFTLTTNDATRETPAVFWFELICRRDIDGISAGTVVSQTLEDNFTVGGMSLVAVLDAIGDSYGLEWRIQTDGTLDVQTKPASGAVGATWGTDRRSGTHLVEGRHGNILAYDLNTDQQVNYLIATGTGVGGNAITVIKQDASSQSTYGLHQAEVGFNVDTIAELATEAATYLTAHKDPAKTMTFDVIVTPDRVWEFAPGDLITVSSALNQDHTGADIAEDLRIIEETRTATDGGVNVRLRLESKPDPFMEHLGGRLGRLENAVENSIERTTQGRTITPERTDGAIYDEDILLDFSPFEEGSDGVVLAIEDTTAGQFYGPEESATVVRVVDRRVTERTLTIRYQRTAGANNYKAHILWWASGRIYRGSRVGS
tara:strand:- start:18977 stop:20917 length:1941 start_codon:yes stop_codon:yes gene_type:complete